MIREIQRSEIDDARWNDLIRSSPDFRHYYLSYFLDAATDSWAALIKNDYEWVWPLPKKHFPIPQVVQPLLAQQLGPFPPSRIAQEELKETWSKLKMKHWRLNVKMHQKLFTDIESTSHVNIELNLGLPYADIGKQYNRNAVSNLKKAINSSVIISKSNEFEKQLLEIFRKGKGRQLGELDDAFYSRVESIYSAFQVRDEAFTWLAKIDNEIVAGAMVFNTRGRLLLFFTAANDASRLNGAMHAILDTIIKENAEKSEVLDFEGSDDPNLAFFYKSFGGNEQIYLQCSTNWRIPFLNRLLS